MERKSPFKFDLAGCPPGNEALLHKEDDKLIVEPMPRPSLLKLLSTWEPLDEKFPEIDDLEPIEDVNL